MNLTTELKKIGLNDSEAAVYLYLLQNGLSSPPQISKGTGIARTNCYHLFRSLKEKSLIRETKSGARIKYAARDPRALLVSLEQKKEMVKELLPELELLSSTQLAKPKIRFYEGLEEVKNIYRETLFAEKVFGMGSVKQLAELDPIFYKRYIRELKKRHIIFDDILTHSSQTQVGQEIAAELRKLYRAKFLPGRYADIPTDMLLWGDNVAVINLSEPVFGTVLTNPALSQTFRIMFEVMWRSLGES